MKQYVTVRTVSLEGSGYAGENGVVADPIEWKRDATGGAFGLSHPRAGAAIAAATEAFKASGAFPGYRPMRALVRVDCDPPVVCGRRGRYGW